MNTAARIFLYIALLPVALWTAWLWGLALRSLKPRPAPPKTDSRPYFTVIIPAHDEELVIREAVERILAFDYPADRFSVHVVADNCADATMKIALEAGAICHVRQCAEKCGKGYAIAFGLEAVAHEPYDAVLFFDADSSPQADYLAIIARHIVAGDGVIQGCYAITDPARNWFTRLTTVSFTLRNKWIFPALDALGMPIPLRGSGMCFPADIIRRLGWQAHSLTEDAEMTLRLIEEGVRISFAPAAVSGQYMPPTPEKAASQRLRWSAGESGMRGRIIKNDIPRALGAGNYRALPSLLLMAAPAFSVQLCAVAALLALSLPIGTDVFIASLAVLAAYALYFFIGFGKPDSQMAAAVAMLPVFAIWRTVIAIKAVLRKPGVWVRTPRK